jgi:hypothetical protein
MAYAGLSMADLRNLIKQRFSRKNLERDARDIKLNRSKVSLIQILEQSDINPPLSNKDFLRVQNQRQQQEEFRQQILQRQQREELQNRIREQVRQQAINRLRNLLPSSPVNSFNELARLNYQFNSNDVDTLFRNIRNKYTITFTFSNGQSKTFTITRENINNLRDVITSKAIVPNPETGEYYNPLLEYEGLSIISMEIKEYTGINRRRNNGFFAYRNKTDINLTKYQIYNKDDTKRENENVCCLIHTLRHNGIDEDVLKRITAFMSSIQLNIPLSKMNDICKIINKSIKIDFYDEKEQRIRKASKRDYTYGKEFSDDVIIISQFKNHFFVNEITEYTSFYIINKEKIDNRTDIDNSIKTKINKCRTIKGKDYYYSINPTFLTSLELVVLMFENNYFNDYHVDLLSGYSDNYSLPASISNIELEQRNEEEEETKVKETKNSFTKKEEVYFFADTEADVSTKKHEMIAFGICDLHGDYHQVVYSKNFKNDIRNSLIEIAIKSNIIDKEKINGKYKQDKNMIIFFHNLKYDATLLNSIFQSFSEVEKDGQIYSKKYSIDFGFNIELRDSMKHFGGKLSDSSKTFGLSVYKGDAIGYTYHTKNNIQSKRLISSKRYCEHLEDSKHDLFYSNINNASFFDATSYYLEYLKADVILLKDAMLKYQELILSITDLDPFKYLTISSIGFEYAKRNNCFTNCSEVCGTLREFIQQSIKGGRVYVNPEYKNKCINEKIEDFDGVSLYPSSMKRLCETYGLPIGKIKKSTIQEYDYYESKDWYIVKIIVSKINKKIQIPCVSIKDVDGSLKYINEIENNIELIVDKLTLNNYIMYQDIEFKIIEGIYWDEGFNKNIGVLIENLHNERCKWKKTNKPKATMIKLIMNSIYGKCGQRISEDKTVFIPKNKKDQYIFDNFGVIVSIEDNEFNSKITQRVCDDSYSLNYVAGMILSQSKDIMNEVFSVYDENNLPVYYTDTDSIHMLQKDVTLLEEKYNEKYSRELIGKNLGQFHTDFEMDDCKNVHSIKHIPIETKTYLDILQGEDVVTGEIKYEPHIRIKGITKSGIDYELQSRMKKDKIDIIQASTELFLDIANEKEVTFYLNPTDYNVSFDFKNNSVYTKETKSFTRVLNKK